MLANAPIGAYATTRSLPRPTVRSVAIPIGIATDLTVGRGSERVVAYAPIGAFASIDSGKHWAKLSGIASANAPMYISVAFYLRHSLYVVGSTGSYGCK